MTSHFPHRVVGALVLLLAGIAQAAEAPAPLPAGYAFKGIGDLLAEKIPYVGELTDIELSRLRYENRVLAAATAVNGNGDVFGFWLQEDGQFRSHSIHLGSNPQFDMLDTADFVTLSGSDAGCAWGIGSICVFWGHDNAFGIRVVPPANEGDPLTGFTALINPTDAALITGSLPLSIYPGNFVSENAAGVIATTQAMSGGQYGVLVSPAGQILLPIVPWLVAINDLEQPLVLGYDGDDGDCLVFGEGCSSDDDEQCVDDNGHLHHGHGRGHEEHGRGNGYGHENCICGVTVSAESGIAPRDGILIGIGSEQITGDIHIAPEAASGALLLRLLADQSLVAYRFPAAVGSATASRVFPLAINSNRAILRGDITNGSSVLDKRLLSCVFDPAALDANDDEIVDCIGGMTLPGDANTGIRVGTVLGFELNDAGRLLGNYGYNAAGVGTPFVIDINAATPAPAPLADLATNATGWELNTVTDLNGSGRITGYGYRECSAYPDAFYIDESVTAPDSGLRFVRGDFEHPAWLASNGRLAIAPTVTGGSGNYEYRVYQRTPAASEWTLHSDWTGGAADYQPDGYEGEVCLRVQVRDTAAPERVREEIVRYRIGADPVAGDAEGDGVVANITPRNSESTFSEWLGGATPAWLLLTALLALRGRGYCPDSRASRGNSPSHRGKRIG